MQTSVGVDDAAVHLRSYSSDQAKHAHPFHQMVLPLAGTLELEIEGRGGRVAGMQAVLVPAGARHVFCGRGNNQFVVVDLPHALVDKIDAEAWLNEKRRQHFFSAPRLAMRLAAVLADEAGVEASPTEVKKAWATLVLQAAVASPRSWPAPVDAAVRYIDAQALRAICVAEIAHAAGVSCGHLHALFREHVGRTPQQEVLRRRLQAAQALLCDPEIPISDVALRCGFADQASFTRAVKRVLGSTPGRLRRVARAQ